MGSGAGGGNPFRGGGDSSLAVATGFGQDPREARRRAVVGGAEFSGAEMEGSAKSGTPRSVVEAIERRQEEGRR